MFKSLMVSMVLVLSFTGCAKKKTTDKNMTKRQTVAQMKAEAEKAAAEAQAKAELEAKLKAEEDAKEKAANASTPAPATPEEPKKEEPVVAVPAPVDSSVGSTSSEAGTSTPPVAEGSTSVKPALQAKGSGQAAQAPKAGEGLPPEVAQRVQEEGKKALQKLTDQAQAAEKGDLDNAKPGSPEADWVKVIEYISENGKHDSAQGMEQFLSLDDYSSTNKNEPYNRKMISLVGGVDSQGKFGFSRIHATDEDWSIDEKGHRVGMIYMFLLGRDGTLAKSWYKKLVKEATEMERVVEDKFLDLSEADAKARWEKSREYWVKKVVRNK